MDWLTAEQRSRNMSAIRSRGNKSTEKAIRFRLVRKGLRGNLAVTWQMSIWDLRHPDTTRQSAPTETEQLGQVSFDGILEA